MNISYSTQLPILAKLKEGETFFLYLMILIVTITEGLVKKIIRTTDIPCKGLVNVKTWFFLIRKSILALG